MINKLPTLKLPVCFGLLFFVAFAFGSESVLAQNDNGFIYGKITTIENKNYEGPIRWGKEEVFWFDMFNSSKPENPYLEYLRDIDRDDLENDCDCWKDRVNKIMVRSGWYGGNSHTHSFAVNFGDIKSIEITGRERITLEMKDGNELRLKGGSNDIGAKVQVYDSEIGIIGIDWDRITRVEFNETPSRLANKFGEPLYGTVSTRNGDFEGFVQWDHDERVGTDKLDGDSDDGDLSIEFSKIASIEKEGRGSLVVLKSGREFFLTGSNDVNRENRGIIVNIPGSGRVDIPWDHFRKLTFMDRPSIKAPSFRDYKSSQPITGSVKHKNGETLTGTLVYDLDEAYDYEILQGDDDDIEYLIPFRDIRKITPLNYSHTEVELKNGKKVVLSGSQDVEESNDGILIFKRGSEDPDYVAWENVAEINLD